MNKNVEAAGKLNVGINSKIKIINPNSEYYTFRGTVTNINKIEKDGQQIPVSVTVNISYPKTIKGIEFNISEIDNIQQKFIDIENLRSVDIQIDNDIIRKGNGGAFEPGDVIQITEKYDGANASICYNPDIDTLEMFSRTKLLTDGEDLRGFKAYINKHVDLLKIKNYPNIVIFGEWCVQHAIKYNAEHINTWKVYDMYDRNTNKYLLQSEVKKIAADLNLEYIHELYNGPFISWDHCSEFLHKNTYGDSQEGIVIKNQTKLNNDEIRFPKVLKIVNKDFSESKLNKVKKEIDVEMLKKLQSDTEKLMMVVTEARVKKFICKFIDEGLIPNDLTPTCMSTVCKLIPKVIYEDVVKEEKELVGSIENAGSIIAKLSTKLAKDIIIGK